MKVKKDNNNNNKEGVIINNSNKIIRHISWKERKWPKTFEKGKTKKEKKKTETREIMERKKNEGTNGQITVREPVDSIDAFAREMAV